MPSAISWAFQISLQHRHIPRAVLLKRLYLVGIIAFAVLLAPMSQPHMYSNSLSRRDSQVNMYVQMAQAS